MFPLINTHWTTCVNEQHAYLFVRKIIFFLLFQPLGSSLLVFIVSICLLSLVLKSYKFLTRVLLSFLIVLLVSLQYQPLTTRYLTNLLSADIPSSVIHDGVNSSKVIVLVGRGQQIAKATTKVAIEIFNSQNIDSVYISGDDPRTALRLIDGGISSELVFGDSCAKNTWENALYANTWIQNNYPQADVILVTDIWQLKRASQAFLRFGINTSPVFAVPDLPERAKNFLAKREFLALMYYYVTGRY